ncbi:MAG: DNA polymerase Y family protein [Pseudomonadota bacterium]
MKRPVTRRVIAIALPHLGAEHRLRREGLTGLTRPFALAGQEGGALRLVSLNAAARAAGLGPGMGLADARAICPSLITRPAEPERLEAFIGALLRWASRFAPLVGRAPDAVSLSRSRPKTMPNAPRGRRGDTTGTRAEPAVAPAASTAPAPTRQTGGTGSGTTGTALILDATGCTHLFGGEAAMLETILAGLGGLGLTARAAMADSKGAAWALAEYGEARIAIAPPGQNRASIADLPPAALRLEPTTAEGLASVGLRNIGEMAGIPRAQLARRFGVSTVRRLDQALGIEPEPVAPARTRRPIAARLTLAEPIGLVSDVEAGLDRLLESVSARLEADGLGARALTLTARRVDGADISATIRLARPMRDPMRLRALFAPKIAELDAGYGIDALRLAVPQTEPMQHAQARTTDAGRTGSRSAAEVEALSDLISRIGNRIGFEQVTRLLPAESHIPERAFIEAAAAWSAPGDWRAACRGTAPPRPITLFDPEPISAHGLVSAPIPDAPRTTAKAHRSSAPAGTLLHPPTEFRWRRQRFTRAAVWGPERLAPEWWWHDPAWTSGPRDYWRVATVEGPRLWLFHTPAAESPSTRCWHVHGIFA